MTSCSFIVQIVHEDVEYILVVLMKEWFVVLEYEADAKLEYHFGLQKDIEKNYLGQKLKDIENFDILNRDIYWIH